MLKSPVMMEVNDDYFETMLFAALVKDASFFGVLQDKVDVRIFDNMAYRKVVSFFKDFWKEYERFPEAADYKLFLNDEHVVRMFKEAFDGEVKTLDPKDFRPDEFYPQAERFIKRKRMLLAFSDLIDRYKSNDFNASEAVSTFESIAAFSLERNLGYDIYEDIAKYLENVDSDKDRLPTGFTMVDKYINGGINANGKFLGVVSAPTNMGKSIFLANLAVNALKLRKTVLIISLEMSEAVYASRIYSALYDMDISELPLNRELLRERVEKRRYGRMLIKEFPPGTKTVEEIDGYIDEARRAGWDFDLICIDYLTLLAAPGADNTNEAGKTIARKLRALSYKYECPVFTAAQINRDGFGLTPDMKYMAESIAICSESDLILSLYRNEEDAALNIMRVYFLKSRLGPNGITVKLYFDNKKLKFENMLEDEENARKEAGKDDGAKKIEKDNEMLSDSITKLLESTSLDDNG